jgi:hypothetical protein
MCGVQNSSPQALQEYSEYAHTLLPKFHNMVTALQDFKSTGRRPDQKENEVE